MIKAIILDVDGVIIGEKNGYNFPDPHPDVIKKLKALRQKGTLISLCTAKPHYSIQNIIKDARLNNLHITNGGGVIINPMDNIILKKHFMNKDDVITIIKTYLESDTYTEFYSVNEYFIQSNQRSELTNIHTAILQRNPHVVEDLINEVQKQEIVKIMPIAKNEEDKRRLTDLFEPFKNKATLSWGIHPVALPHQFGIITTKDISKKQAVFEIAQFSKISPDEILGVGDSLSDWQFIELCKYGGAMGNASGELKKLVLSKGKEYSYIGKNVDENGVLDVFNYFSL